MRWFPVAFLTNCVLLGDKHDSNSQPLCYESACLTARLEDVHYKQKWKGVIRTHDPSNERRSGLFYMYALEPTLINSNEATL